MTTPKVVEITSPGEITVVEVLIPGIPGPPGGAFYTHTQSAAAAEWIVNHNLGVRPLIAVFTNGGVEAEVHIVHNSTNQARIYFATPQTGTARCV